MSESTPENAAESPGSPVARTEATPANVVDIELISSPRIEGDELLTEGDVSAIARFKSIKFGKLQRMFLLRVQPVNRRQRVMCVAGEPGNTAFYILTRDEALALRRHQLSQCMADTTEGSPPNARRQALEAEIGRLEALSAAATGETASSVAKVYMIPPGRRESGTIWQRVKSWMRLSKNSTRRSKSRQFLLGDAPMPVDPGTREAELREGDLFGEMACLDRLPRFATVVTHAPCYIVEFLRPALDALRASDEAIDSNLAARMTEVTLTKGPLFAEIGSGEVQYLQSQARLVEVKAGDALFEDGDVPDGFYVIVNGLLKVLQGARTAIPDETEIDWPALIRELEPTAPPSATAPAAGGGAASLMALIKAQAPSAPAAKEAGATPVAEPATPPVPSTAEPAVSEPPVASVPPVANAPAAGEGPAALIARMKAKAAQAAAANTEGETAAGEPSPPAVPPVSKPALPKPPVAAAGPTTPAKSTVGDSPREFWREKFWQSWRALAANAKHPTLTSADREALTQIDEWLRERPAASPVPGDDRRKRLLSALNAFVRGGELAKSFKTTDDLLDKVPDLQRHVLFQSFGPRPENWSGHEVRTFQRWVVEFLAPQGLSALRTSRPLRKVLAYLQPGDVVGEIGSLRHQPRNATCLAYDHPDTGAYQKVPGGDGRLPGSRLLALKIPLTDPAEFRRQCPKLAARLDELATVRLAETEPPPAVFESAEFQQMGLFQGQHLMLIDLQKCTRCNACVEACIDSHEDHRPRLHLDGPRITFGATPYLAPLTCRQCLDPVCMIPCPVGSILRIDNGAIQITDWCIGCSKCAMACPYGSIQMHETTEAEREHRSEHFLRLLEPGFRLNEVIEQAVVCDLCSQSALGQPACVYACPHDATFRDDARRTFSRENLARS